jgi:hypothetical protein
VKVVDIGAGHPADDDEGSTPGRVAVSLDPLVALFSRVAAAMTAQSKTGIRGSGEVTKPSWLSRGYTAGRPGLRNPLDDEP